jgi:hypothetical protein
VGTLINHIIAIPASFVVAWFLAHAIHADFATAWHLERYNIPLNEMRPEYWVEGVAQRFFSRDTKARCGHSSQKYTHLTGGRIRFSNHSNPHISASLRGSD